MWDPTAKAFQDDRGRWQNPGWWLKFHNVWNLRKLRQHLSRRWVFPTAWLYCNVYHKRTRELLGSFTSKSGEPPARPTERF